MTGRHRSTGPPPQPAPTFRADVMEAPWRTLIVGVGSLLAITWGGSLIARHASAPMTLIGVASILVGVLAVASFALRFNPAVLTRLEQRRRTRPLAAILRHSWLAFTLAAYGTAFARWVTS